MNDGEVKYKEIPPHPLLQDYVKTYWFFSFGVKDIRTFEVLPDGYFDLIISLKNDQIDQIRLVGIWSKRVTVDYTEDTQIIGIRFKPPALLSLLDIRIKELLDSGSFVDLRDWKFNQSLLENDTSYDPYLIKQYFDTHLLSVLNSKKIDKRVNGLFNLIEKSSGCISIGELSRTVGLSTRQIHRKTTDLIGIGAKDYAQIIKFKNVLSLIKEDKSNYEGYFDQSHFIKNFKLYTGLRPSEVDLGEDVRFLQYFDFDAD